MSGEFVVKKRERRVKGSPNAARTVVAAVKWRRAVGRIVARMDENAVVIFVVGEG